MSDPTRRHTILHVIAHMEKGGAERQMMLLTGASRHRHVIVVLAGNETASDWPVVLLPGLDPRVIYRTVRQAIQEHEVDIAQLWLPDRLTIPSMFAARAEGCRIISGDRRKVRNYGRGALRDRLPYIVHLAADRVVANYPHFPPRLSLRRLLRVPRKFQTIPNGLDLTPRVVPVPDTPRRLLFVGRLVEQKRVAQLVDTLPALKDQAGITGLDIVGDGPEEPGIRARIAANGLQEAVTLHGRLGDWGTRFDPGSHMLVLPSASEGMSNTVFEAIAWGYLPVTSHSPELAAILRDWSAPPPMFDHGDPASLVAVIRDLHALPPGGAEARVRAMQARLGDFSVARMAGAYDALYDQLMRIQT